VFAAPAQFSSVGQVGFRQNRDGRDLSGFGVGASSHFGSYLRGMAPKAVVRMRDRPEKLRLGLVVFRPGHGY